MNIQIAFIYALLTFLLIYGIQTLDYKYFSSEKDERIFRNSILCSVITWIVIVFFIYKSEIDIPNYSLKQQTIL